MRAFALGQRVVKDSGDYVYEGVVVGLVWKRSGELRYVVEDDRGLLFIFHENSLKLVQDPGWERSGFKRQHYQDW